MDFDVDTGLQARLDAIGEFVDGELVPLEPLLLAGDHDALVAAIEEQRRAVKSEGWWAPHLPAEVGGSSAGLVPLGLISEVLGRTPLGHVTFGCQAPDAGNAELLLSHGTEAQRATYLAPLAAGEIRSCFCMTEPEQPGSNPVLLSTTARTTDDGWVIDGHKWFSTAADGARFAVIMAVTDPDAPRHERASMFLAETDAPGFEMVRNIPVMGHAGAGYFSHAEVRFDGLRLGADALLGERGRGFAMAQERLGPGRIHHCMRWLGICRRALDELCRYSLKREVAPGRRLADQQIVQAWIAESAAEIEAARMMVLRAAWDIDQKGFRAARHRISMIKYFTAGVMQRALDRAIQAHGALGVTDDTVLAFFFREERGARIYDGPDEVHKLSVARQLLKRYVGEGEAT